MTSSQNIIFDQLNHSRVYLVGLIHVDAFVHEMRTGVGGHETVENMRLEILAVAGHRLDGQRDGPRHIVAAYVASRCP